MKEAITSFVGLDVHKDSIAVAVAQAGRQAPRFIGTVVPRLASLQKVLGAIGHASRTLVVYEAGPCGYGLARRLTADGYSCEVVAPARIARSPIDQRIKTDRRDALLLARESRAGNLVPVVIPDERDEALRDLSRTREDALAARLRAHQQMKALLLRQGRCCPGRIAWSAAHERTLSQIRLPHPAQAIAFVEYRNSIKDAHERLERITEALRLQSSHWRMRPLVQALMCLRGFDFVAAVTFVAEIGDARRFAHPTGLMSYLGLVPSEFSSGKSRHQGSITKTGNKHARRILIEAAWTYCHSPRVGRSLEVRQQGQPKTVRDISWRAQLRLTKRFRHLRMGRKLPQNKVCVAIARELCGFIWDIARQVEPLA
jgi:transposase